MSRGSEYPASGASRSGTGSIFSEAKARRRARSPAVGNDGLGKRRMRARISKVCWKWDIQRYGTGSAKLPFTAVRDALSHGATAAFQAR